MTFTGTWLYEQPAGVSRSNNSRWQINSTLLSTEQSNCGKFPVLFPFLLLLMKVSSIMNRTHCTLHSIHIVNVAFGDVKLETILVICSS
jgi:hypothetical protein